MPLTLHAWALSGLSLVAAANPIEVCLQAKALGQSAPSWAMLQMDKELAKQTVVVNNYTSSSNFPEPVAASEVAAVTLDSWGSDDLRDWA
mmetsp:Transcript_21465/g.49133  ORF Transcript_21465/g.49133 Transcript_21465/m.49133 type:complete len:90 (+) Transcript_21465:84-353(+)